MLCKGIFDSCTCLLLLISHGNKAQNNACPPGRQVLKCCLPEAKLACPTWLKIVIHN